jgi:uncharacterized protein (TIGR02300 family)
MLRLSSALSTQKLAHMTTTTLSNKEDRGTKRVCLACEVRFYDLKRDPIVCPSCGGHFTPVALAAVALGTRKTPVAKSAWRQRVERPGVAEPTLDVDNPAPAETADAADIEATSEETANASPDDDTVLVEQDGDDSDVTDLVELDLEDPNPKET